MLPCSNTVLLILQYTQHQHLTYLFSWNTPVPLIQYIDKMVDVPVAQVVQVLQVRDTQSQTTEKIIEIPEIQTIQSSRTSEVLGTAPGRHVAVSEVVEVVKLGPPLPAESAPPMFVTANIFRDRSASCRGGVRPTCSCG